MASKIYHRGPWQIPYKATDVLCSDGVRRTARLSGEADTWFSMPASVQVKGKTVTGSIMHRGYDSDTELDLAFYPDQWRKNANVLPREEATR